MATEAQFTTINNYINALLEETPAYFLVQVIVKPTNNIKIFIDGDQGITIETCSRLNRKLYRQIEEVQLFPDGDFSLEVSSPGVGEPLMMHRQYVKNTGRSVIVQQAEGPEIEGELKEVTEHGITLETITGKGKKAEIKQHVIPFQNVKTTTVQIKF